MMLSWMARVGSIFSILFLLVIMVGEGELPLVLSVKETLMIVFFPFGVVLGMVLAWWNERERMGGLMTILSLSLFYVTDFAFTGKFPRGPYFLLFAFPGILFLIHDLSSTSLRGKD